MSFKIAALIKNKVNPAQINKTKSTGGILSVNPLITAKIDGTVAAWMIISPIQAMDSAVAAVSFVLQNSIMLSKLTGKV